MGKLKVWKNFGHICIAFGKCITSSGLKTLCDGPETPTQWKSSVSLNGPMDPPTYSPGRVLEILTHAYLVQGHPPNDVKTSTRLQHFWSFHLSFHSSRNMLSVLCISQLIFVSNYKMHLSYFSIAFVQVTKCICPNCKMYLSGLFWSVLECFVQCNLSRQVDSIAYT